MKFADKHELAMLRSTDKLMEQLNPNDPHENVRGLVRGLLDMAFSQGALFVLEDDLHQLEEKYEPTR